MQAWKQKRRVEDAATKTEEGRFTDNQQTHGGSASLYPNFAPLHCAKLRHASNVVCNCQPAQEKEAALKKKEKETALKPFEDKSTSKTDWRKPW
jgi:hypothetical protein